MVPAAVCQQALLLRPTSSASWKWLWCRLQGVALDKSEAGLRPERRSDRERRAVGSSLKDVRTTGVLATVVLVTGAEVFVQVPRHAVPRRTAELSSAAQVLTWQTFPRLLGACSCFSQGFSSSLQP